MKHFEQHIIDLMKDKQFAIVELQNIKLASNQEFSIYIAKQANNSDYYILLNLPHELLADVNRTIQINIVTLIKQKHSEYINDSGIEVNESFDKNSTLIILTNNGNTNANSILQQAIEIEEDPYFFKKHVLVTNDEEIAVFRERFANKDNLMKGIVETISNLGLFNNFTDGKNKTRAKAKNKALYSIVTKLYEKLPFLKLELNNSQHENLIETINSELLPEDKSYRDELLALSDNQIETWINEQMTTEASND